MKPRIYELVGGPSCGKALSFAQNPPAVYRMLVTSRSDDVGRSGLKLATTWTAVYHLWSDGVYRYARREG